AHRGGDRLGVLLQVQGEELTGAAAGEHGRRPGRDPCFHVFGERLQGDGAGSAVRAPLEGGDGEEQQAVETVDQRQRIHGVSSTHERNGWSRSSKISRSHRSWRRVCVASPPSWWLNG